MLDLRRGLGLGLGYSLRWLDVLSQRERQELCVVAPRFCTAAKRLGFPSTVGTLSNVLDPSAQGLQRGLSERQQAWSRRALLSEHRVEHLLHRPAGFAELVEPDHSRTALERVEGPTQGGEMLQIPGLGSQMLHRCLAMAHHFARLLQKDVEQIVILIVCIALRQRLWRHRRRCGLRQFDQGLGSRHCVVVDHRMGRIARGPGHARLLGQRSLIRQVVELLTEIGEIHRVLRTVDHPLHASADGLCLHTGRLCCRAGGQGAAHQRQQLAQGLVEGKQLFRQRRLVVEHIHQKAERAEVVAQLLEGARLPGHGLVHLRVEDLLHHGAHVGHRLHGLFQAQHRQHAPHLRQLRDGHMEPSLFTGRAEELVERFLSLAQRHLEFSNDAAHGLAIAHSPIQLLHPAVQGSCCFAGQHTFEPRSQRLRTLREFLLRRVEVFERRFQVQRGGGDLHRQLWTHTGRIMRRMVHRLHQSLSQDRAGRVQLEQGVADQAELIHHLACAVEIATREKRPRLLGRIDALARLHQHRGIVASKRRLGVVHRLCVRQPKGLTHRAQLGRFPLNWRVCLGAEKEQIVQQRLRDLGLVRVLREGGKLQQHAGRGPLDIHVGWQQILRDGLEKGCSDTPEGDHARPIRTSRQAGAQASQLLRRRRALSLHHQKHQTIQQRAHGSLGLHRLGPGRSNHVVVTVLEGPEVCRVHTLGSRQFLHVAVLREQGNRLHRLVVENSLEVLHQREAGAFHLARGLIGTVLRLLHETLHCGLHGTQHLRWCHQPHHLQSAHRLVQLLPGQTQGGRINRLQVVVARLLGLAHETLDGFGGGVERFAQFFKHPGQRTQVGQRNVRSQATRRGVEHGVQK